MKKETIYKWIIGILLVINGIQLAGFLFAPKPPGPPMHEGGDFRDRAIKTLNLDSEQKELFFKSAEKHRTTIDSLNKKQKEIIVSQFNNPSETKLTTIKEIESQKIKATHTNFNEIKKILKPEQMPNFEEFKKQALQVIIR